LQVGLESRSAAHRSLPLAEISYNAVARRRARSRAHNAAE